MEKYKKLEWSKAYEVGNSEIDEDHKGLIRIYNEVLEIILRKKNRKQSVNILTDLTNYSLMHFKKEEDWMQAISYPGFESHQSEHKDFIYKIAMFNLSFDSSDQRMIYDILNFLREWIVNHLKTCDKEIAQFTLEKTITN